MAKTLTEAQITTREARVGLPIGLHWRGLDREVHLGYRKGKRGGVWLVRWRNGVGYRQEAIGTADDNLKAGTLDYYAASKQARAVVERAREAAAANADGAPLTVRMAVESYVASRDARDSKRAGRQKRSDAGQRLSHYLLGQGARGRQAAIPAATLSGVPLHSLKESDLLSWRAELPAAMKATTRQRLINDLKAALNGAYAASRDRLPPTLPGAIKHGLRALEVDEAEPLARDNQILADAEIGRLIRAAREIDEEQDWGGDLFRLVLVLTATGTRFSQAARIRVGDCQVKAGRLMVPTSRKGRGAKAGTTTVPIGRDVIDELIPVVAGRAAAEPLLQRWRHEQSKGGIEWHRARRGAWTSSAELQRPWQVIRERAGLPDAIPYSLRHSSIVRGIRANLPIRLVAALHDTSVAMIEKHYSKWITSGLEEMVRAAIVPIVPPGDGASVIRFPVKEGA